MADVLGIVAILKTMTHITRTLQIMQSDVSGGKIVFGSSSLFGAGPEGRDNSYLLGVYCPSHLILRWHVLSTHLGRFQNLPKFQFSAWHPQSQMANLALMAAAVRSTMESRRPIYIRALDRGFLRDELLVLLLYHVFFSVCTSYKQSRHFSYVFSSASLLEDYSQRINHHTQG